MNARLTRFLAQGAAVTDTLTPQAGWYPDPTDSRAYRWWSGGAWTDHLTAAPSADSFGAESVAAAQALPIDVDALPFAESTANPFNSSFKEPGGITLRAERNRTGVVVVIIGLVAVGGYFGSLAFAYSTILPLIPGLIGLLAAVPAFRRARITGDGLAISLLGVLLSGAASVLSILPLVPMILGVPSAAEVTGTQNLIADTIGYHSTVEGKLVASAQSDFGQAAASANCPSTALATAGSTFTCSETLADGTTKTVNVTVTDDKGAFTSTPAA